MLSISTTLAIFILFGLSSLAIFWARFIRLPHTVFLVIIGLVLGYLAQFDTFQFFNEFQLTPELIFYLLLPTLIFESAFNINARRLVEDTVPILVFSIVSLVVSAVIIATGLYFLFDALGLTVPFIITLLFGALISATDPVAVLALFKEYGAPRRLSLIFEGESLFNDATSVAFFLIVLEIALVGFHGVETVVEGTYVFTSMIIGGILFGGIMGGLFAWLIGLTRESEAASITLTIVLAHITFILAELISHHVTIGGTSIHISAIIATTIASLIMGNYGRAKIHPEATEFVAKLWEQFAFMANSIIFILIGFLFVTLPFSNSITMAAVGITIIVVALARAVSIYPVAALLNLVSAANRTIPLNWQHLLSWGSLRGALAVTMVLLIPDTLVIPGWDVPGTTPQSFLLALTVGCIFATLFIKAPTIQPLMRRLKLDAMTAIEKVECAEAQALMHHEVVKELRKYSDRGYLDPAIANDLIAAHEQEFAAACRQVSALSSDERENLAARILRMYAIGIEKQHLKNLYQHHDINEPVFRRVWGKLTLQFEAIEQGNLEPNMSLHTDGKDVFERIASWLRDLVQPFTAEEKIEQQYLYYRAQTIIARKVLKELESMERDFAASIFTKNALHHVIELYTTFKTQSEKKMKGVHDAHAGIIDPLTRTLANVGVAKIERTVVRDVFARELITPKLYVTLTDDIKEHCK